MRIYARIYARQRACDLRFVQSYAWRMQRKYLCGAIDGAKFGAFCLYFPICMCATPAQSMRAAHRVRPKVHARNYARRPALSFDVAGGGAHRQVASAQISAHIEKARIWCRAYIRAYTRAYVFVACGAPCIMLPLTQNSRAYIRAYFAHNQVTRA